MTPLFPENIFRHSDPETECMEAIISHSSEVAMYSAKSITQMGLFQDCIQSGLKYGLLALKDKNTSADLEIEMGLCIPQVCQREEVE